MLIDLFSSDLVAGYKEIVTAREALQKKWRFDLLRAYTRQRERYEAQLAWQEANKERYQQQFLPVIGVVLLAVCGVGAWLTFRNLELACLGMFLMLGAGFGALLALTPVMKLSQTLPLPENPVTGTSGEEDESPLRQKLFPDLVPLWQRRMRLRVPDPGDVEQMAAESGRWGLIGELDLVRELERAASPETYILHSLHAFQAKANDDMDVVVIGPKGFWYFEVKHWNADFVWQDGAWQVWQFDQETRRPQTVPLREDPDAQWRRMRDEALAVLQATEGSAADLLKKAPVLGNIQGGIVFTHPGARVEIERSAPFRYGNIEQWIATYQAAPRLKGITPGRALQLLEVLLERHRSFHPNVPLHSMKGAVADVIAEAEAGIQQWIEG
jgi:hypothetical protein